MQFEKGQSGNPGGRPKDQARIKELAREHTEEAVARLVHWMKSDNAKASVSACQALLDRGYGKPTQPLSGDDDRPPVLIEIVDPILKRGTA